MNVYQYLPLLLDSILEAFFVKGLTPEIQAEVTMKRPQGQCALMNEALATENRRVAIWKEFASSNSKGGKLQTETQRPANQANKGQSNYGY